MKFHVDETFCITPRKHVVNPSIPSVGADCKVKWSSSEVLDATVLAVGEYY